MITSSLEKLCLEKLLRPKQPKARKCNNVRFALSLIATIVVVTLAEEAHATEKFLPWNTTARDALNLPSWQDEAHAALNPPSWQDEAHTALNQLSWQDEAHAALSPPLWQDEAHETLDLSQWDQSAREMLMPNIEHNEIQQLVNSISQIQLPIHDDTPQTQGYAEDASLQAATHNDASSANGFFSFEADFISNLFIDDMGSYAALNNHHYIGTDGDNDAFALSNFMADPAGFHGDIGIQGCGDTFS